MKRIDHGRARFIARRLREAGDTPAAELIDDLIRERELIFGSISFVPANAGDEEAERLAEHARKLVMWWGGVVDGSSP